MMNIRTETEQDWNEVYTLHYKAFGNREDESRLVARIRKSEGFVPELSLVAERDGRLLGHVLISRATVEDAASNAVHDVMVLAPVGVDPNDQKTGVGTRLIREALERCRDMGVSLVLLIGHPGYYPRLGFQPARPYGLELRQFEVPDEVFMVYEGTEGALGTVRGELKYPGSFFG